MVSMQIGLHALGIGSGARRDVIDAVAAAAEACVPLPSESLTSATYTAWPTSGSTRW